VDKNELGPINCDSGVEEFDDLMLPE